MKSGLFDPYPKPPSYILIYGDSEEKEASKLIWSILGASGIRIENVDDFRSLEDLYADSLLTFVVLPQIGVEPQLIDFIRQNSATANDSFALAYGADTGQRVHLMAAGFDAVFNSQMMQHVDFKDIVLQKVEKGRIRMNHRIMQDEYLRFRSALTSSPDALIVFDNEKRLFFVSEHYKRAYPDIADRLIRGIPVEEAFDLARQEEGIGEDHPDYPQLRNFWLGLTGQIEFMSVKGRHQARVWRLKASPMIDQDGIRQGTIVTTIDVTDMQRHKQALEEKSAELSLSLEKEREASQLQKQFIGMVSHEFRTPLAIIDGHAQVIMRRLDSLELEAIRAGCKTIRSAVSRLIAMMESILSSDILKNGYMEPEITQFDLGELIRELCEEQAELATSHHIIYDVSGLGHPVRLDRKMMTLILSNLIANAIKFTESHPEVSVIAAADTENITITISDNGIGIPQDETDRVFDRYFRSSNASAIPGTGIGLHLVQELLRLQNGTITVESRIGAGTCFTVTLPDIKQGFLT